MSHKECNLTLQQQVGNTYIVGSWRGREAAVHEIYKILPDISPKVLSSTLKSLEQDKLVTRTIYATIPPKVEYRISEDGRTLLPILQELSQWGLMKMAKE